MRYLKASVVIALISAFLVGTLYGTGFARTLEKALRHFYGMPYIGVPPLEGGQFVVLFLFAWAIAWTTVDIIKPILKCVVAFLTILLLFTGSWVMSLYGVFFSPFTSVAAVAVSLGIGLTYGRSEDGMRKKVLNRLFGARLSRRSVQKLVDSEEALSFSGSRVECSVLVCEISNHGHLMSLEPEDYVAMTNLYLRAASDYLVDVGGYLDECDGESIRVIFGAPVADEKHATSALRAALELAVRLDNVNKDCDAQWHRRFDFCIGVHSGEMIAAAYGGTRLGSFSVAGEPVEFTRRLCTAAAIYGARILTTADTFSDTGDMFEARPMDLILEPVTRRRIEIYEILSIHNGLSPERKRSRDHFWKGVIYYRERKWVQAVEELSKARISGLPDAALDYYVQRVERARRGEPEATREHSALVNVL